MEIQSTTPLRFDSSEPPRKHAERSTVFYGDRLNTSKEVLMLSRNLADLKNALAPRSEILEEMNPEQLDPAGFGDPILDRILEKLA